MSGKEMAVVVEDLVKHYGRFEALRGVSFTVPRGSIYGFVGPNGAGKTTTLRILATLLRPTRGRARVAGEDVVRHPERVRRVIGYMPDFFGLYHDLTVREYLEFFASAYDVPRDRRRKIIADLLELVDLGHKRDDYVEGLSRGMQQKLGLARCLVHDPAVLLLDEPASGLDPRARVELREILKELARMGKTVIISSHILPELADICTHIGLIHQGEMVASGPVESVLSRLGRGRVLEVRLLHSAPAAAGVLKGLPGVRDVEAVEEENLVRFAFDGGPEEEHRVLRALLEAGLPVVNFASRAGLEELFLSLIVEEEG